MIFLTEIEASIVSNFAQMEQFDDGGKLTPDGALYIREYPRDIVKALGEKAGLISFPKSYLWRQYRNNFAFLTSKEIRAMMEGNT